MGVGVWRDRELVIVCVGFRIESVCVCIFHECHFKRKHDFCFMFPDNLGHTKT